MNFNSINIIFRISPTHKSAWLNLFISYDNDKLEGKFEFDANYLIKTADEALLSNPTLLDLYLKIGILFAKFESLSKKSEFYLQKAIQLDTKNPNSWMNLGIILSINVFISFIFAQNLLLFKK